MSRTQMHGRIGVKLNAGRPQLDVRPTGDQEVAGSIPAEVGNILSWRYDHEIFSTIILSLPQIQEGQLSVSGERMCTILVFRGLSLSSKVQLGKLTTLDMTPLG